MNFIKKTAAVILVLALALSFTGCHKKNEVAVTVGETSFTSAFYMCCLLNADNQARSEVQETLTEEEAQNGADIDYASKELDGKDYATWVKDKALEMCKNYGTILNKCKELGLTVSEEDEEYNNQYCNYYWNNYGYEAVFSANGVSYDTFKYYNLMGAYETLYFNYLYGTDFESGQTPLTVDDVKGALNEAFAGIYALYTDKSQMDETAVADLTAKYEGYKKDLDKGTPFGTIYLKENDVDIEDTDTGADKYIRVVGNSETNYSNEIWDDVSAMKVNESKVITTDSAVYLVVKKDISGNEYYQKDLYSAVAYYLKGDEFNEKVAELWEEYDFTTAKKAIDQFKVDKIDYGNQ